MTLRMLLCTLALAMGATAFALPSATVLGPTGLLLTPTADALGADEASIAVFGFEGGERAAYVFNYGIRANLEAGFARYTDRETVVNVKYNFQPETDGTVGVALGVLDVTDQVNSAIYIAASKKMETNLPGITNFRLHAGLAAGGDANTTLPLDGIFGGLSIDIAENILVMVEHDGNNVNAGGGILFGNFQAKFGVVGDDQSWFYGLTFTETL